jgi:hypothetical protein
VYEYEPEGTGPEHARCGPGASSGSEAFKPEHAFTVEGRAGTEAAGCVALISSGSGEEAGFLDASEDGEDVFLLSSSKLAPGDREGGLAVWDAHECEGSGGVPCAAPAVPAPPCVSTEGCRGARSPEPGYFGAPSSQTFEGDGNLVPPVSNVPLPPPPAKVVCKRPKRLSHGRCVKPKKSARKRKHATKAVSRARGRKTARSRS